MKTVNKFRKILIVVQLVISLALGSPSYIHAAAEAPSAAEAPTVQSSPSPEPVSSTTPSPTPQPTAAEAPSAPEASPVPNSDPSPTPTTTLSTETSQNNQNDEVDDDPQWKQDLEQQIKDDLERKYLGGNVGDTSIESGDANATGVVVTNVNNSAVDTSGSSCGACSGGATATNSGNGSGSTNDAAISTTNDSSVYVDNDAAVANNLNFDANSGGNDSSKNVGETEIITGDANVVVTVLTNANNVGLDLYQFDVNDNQIGDVVLDTTGLVAQNIGNGSDSTNTAEINNTNTNVETINNDGDIINNIDIDANSGYNTASKNTGGDSTIETGDANVVANVVNVLNTVVDGAMNVVNIFGDMVGNIVQPAVATSAQSSECGCGPCSSDVTAVNSGNGSDSTNTTTVNNTNTDTTNMTNNATIDNNLYLDANTGGNTTSDNTGGFSTVETGDSNVEANVINIANVNATSGSCDPIYFVFINDVSGGWEGQILGAAPGTYFYTSDGSIYFVDANGQLVAMNKDNGADSTNTTTINNTNTNTVDITNNGTVTNNISIDANTGNNDASKNTGGNSSIKTGDANIAVNVLNFINSNFSGRKVVMTLVNVFGSWIGNFVPAGYTGDIPNPNAQATGGSNSNSNSGGSSSAGSTGGGTNVVSVGGQVLAQTAKGTFKSLFAGATVENDGDGSSSTETKVPQYKAVQKLDGTGIPVPLRIILIMMPLAALTFVLRKKAALVAAVNK